MKEDEVYVVTYQSDAGEYFVAIFKYYPSNEKLEKILRSWDGRDVWNENDDEDVSEVVKSLQKVKIDRQTLR